MLRTALLISPVVASLSDLEYYFQYCVCVVCLYVLLFKSSQRISSLNGNLSVSFPANCKVQLQCICLLISASGERLGFFLGRRF